MTTTTVLCASYTILSIALIWFFVLYLVVRGRLDDIKELVRNYHPIDEGASAYRCVDFLGRQFLRRERQRDDMTARAEIAENALSTGNKVILQADTRISKLEGALASTIAAIESYGRRRGESIEQQKQIVDSIRGTIVSREAT